MMRALGPHPADTACDSFPPVEGPRAVVLVLGTMPGQRSLAAQQYYAHPANALWKVMEALGAPRSLDYAARCERVTTLGIALWDVLASCHRPGSLDADIRAPEANDFGPWFARHPEQRAILLNGQKARAFYDRLVPASPAGITLHTMPSTSPANTRAGKVDAWLRVLRLYL